MAHTHAKVAAALLQDRDSARPETLAMAGVVGRDREVKMPAPVSAEATQQPRQHQPLETQRGEIADVAGQAALAAAERRGAREHDEVPPHQP
jgi:hypothetical protein